LAQSLGLPHDEAVAQLASVEVVMYTRADRYVCKE